MDFESLRQQEAEFKAALNKRQSAAASPLTTEEAQTFADFKEIKLKAIDLQQLGETKEYDRLVPKLLSLQDKAKAIEEKLKARPTAQDQLLAAIARNPESELYQKAEALQKDGLEFSEKALAEIESLNAEFQAIKQQAIDVVTRLGDAWRSLYDCYVILRKVEKALPDEKHQATIPPAAPEWTAFDVTDTLAKVYGNRPSRAYLANVR